MVVELCTRIQYSGYLDDFHVDDPDVLDVGVPEELLLEFGPQRLLGDGHVAVLEEDGNLSVPGTVQCQHSHPSLILVQRKEGLHLKKKQK